MKVIRIDMSFGSPDVYASHITHISPRKIVVRDAVRLPEIPEKADYFLVDLTEYESMMAGGYADVIVSDNVVDTVQIVGWCPTNKALRPIPPRKAALVKKGVRVDVETHNSRNADVAQVARSALWELAENDRNSNCVTLVWGGKVETNAVEIHGDCQDWDIDSLEEVIPMERRMEIVSEASVEAATIASEFYYRYYGESFGGTPTEEKHKQLFVSAVLALLGICSDPLFANASRGALAILARRQNFTLNDVVLPSVDEKKIDEIRKLLHPYVLVSGRHVDDDESNIFTWYAPTDLEIAIGDVVWVDTIRGESTITVTEVVPSKTTGGHRKVIRKKALA